jgi:hypothetical protein
MGISSLQYNDIYNFPQKAFERALEDNTVVERQEEEESAEEEEAEAEYVFMLINCLIFSFIILFYSFYFIMCSSYLITV